jgi:ribosomal protein S6--L-glutamate ligase
VVKAGNFHGGLGKSLVRDENQWAEVRDLLFALDDYVCVEPFVDYARDVRVLLIGEQMWAMERRGATWKVQAGAADFALIEPPPALTDDTRRIVDRLGAEVLAVDFLEDRDGKYFALESNDIPGLSGFPDAARHAVANALRDKMRGS